MDKDLELAVINPVEFLSKPQSDREWNMSIDDVARAIKYNPAETLLTKAEQNPQSYGWIKTITANIARGAGSLFSPETGAQALVETYSSPNMSKEKADRLIEDIAYTRYFGKQAEAATRPIGEQLAAEKHPHISGISQGIGQFIAQTLTGMANPYAAWSTIYASSQGQMEEGLVERYIENTGGIEGYADQKRKDDALVGGFAAFNTLIERGLGMERIIESAFRNPTRAGLKSAIELAINPSRILAKQTLQQAGKKTLQGILGEGSEEFAQSYLETGTEVLAGYKELSDLFSDEQLRNAATAAAYGGIVGGAAGFGLHTANRAVVKRRVNEWATKQGLNLSDAQVTQIANDIIDETQDQALNEITTRSELKNKYGEAFEILVDKVKQQITGTGITLPEGEDLDEYARAVAKTIQIPAINLQTWALPTREYLEAADIRVTNGMWELAPIQDATEIRSLIDQQNKIIREQNLLKKQGTENAEILENAQRRKTALQIIYNNLVSQETITYNTNFRRKQQNDYIKAQELRPTETTTLDGAQEAQAGEDFVLFAGKKIPVTYEVVELDSIQPSHINGEANKKYNQALQNRAGRGTTIDIADLRNKAQNFTPERVLTAPTSAEGAPVTNAQGEVIAGNGRAEIIRQVYENNPQAAQAYIDAIKALGFDTRNLQRPILIRRNSTLTEEQQVAAAEISNISEISAFDEASQAKRDTQYLKGSQTPLEFAAKIPMSERRGLMLNNGKWNKRLVQKRYEDALLAWLTGNDPRLFENLVLDNVLPQKVIDTLTANGATIYDLQEKYPDLDIRSDIYHALVKYQRTNRTNFIQATAEQDLNGRDVMPENVILWNFLFANGTTSKIFFEQYTQVAEHNREAVDAGTDIFGEKVAPLSKKDLYAQALKATDNVRAQIAAENGKEYEPLFTETGEVLEPNLQAAFISYQNQFQKQQDALNQLGFTSGRTFYEKPSTKYVLQGGEGAIVHGWGVYLLADQAANQSLYREKFTYLPIFVLDAPETTETEKFDNSVFKDLDATVIEANFPSLIRVVVGNIMSKTHRERVWPGETPLFIDELILDNPKLYGGFFGVYAYAAHSGSALAENILHSIARSKTHLEEVINGKDYKALQAEAKSNTDAKFFLQLLEDAKAIYDSDKEIADFDPDVKSWAAISSAVENMNKKTENLFKKAVDTEIDKDDQKTLLLNIIKQPQNLKRTRGQQLAVEIPEQTELLDENQILAEQASAPILRPFMKDLITMSGITDRVNEKNFKAFKEIYDIPYATIREWHNELFDKIVNGEEDEKEVNLFIDYIMSNMQGTDLLRTLIDTVPDIVLELDDGEEIGEEKSDLYDTDLYKSYNVKGEHITSEHARDVSLWLNNAGIKGISYNGRTDDRGFVIFTDEALNVLKRLDDEEPMYYQGRKTRNAWYDPELQIIALTKNWNKTSLVHEMHHHYLNKILDLYRQAQAGLVQLTDFGQEQIKQLFEMLDITDPSTATPQQITVAQEKFATMTEAYLTGLGVKEPENQVYKDFLKWIPEKYKSILNIGYLNEKNEIVNPILDEDAIRFFNKWFEQPQMPTLPTSPDAQSLVNPKDSKGQIIPSSQPEMNDRGIKWGTDAAEQIQADKKLYNRIDEDTPSELRAAIDGAKVDFEKPAEDNITLPQAKRERWFRTGQKDAQQIAADKAREYVAKNPEHARELALSDPEISTVYDAPIDRAWLIRAVMETTDKGSEEYAILYDNLATYRSMSGSTLGLTNDMSQRAYLDAKREIEDSREVKAAINYAGTSRGSWDKWTGDIKAFINARTAKILATEAGSEERKRALKAFLEEAKTKFSGNTENAILNQLDLTGVNARSKAVFIKWAEKAIKQASGVGLTSAEQAELITISQKAQNAMLAIDNLDPATAAAAARDIRTWQIKKDELKKANFGRFDKLNNWVNTTFGGYVPSAMLMSFNTLFVANIPSTAINTAIVRSSTAKIYGKNAVDKKVTDNEIKRIQQVFRASGMNLAQMEKPTSPSLMHGEKYSGQDKKHWYDFTFDVLSWGDNKFRIPTFVDTLARIATRNANGDSKLATEKFHQYAQINNTSEEAQIARKQALATANMAVFTQDGILSTGLNHIRADINKISRGLLGLEKEGFGLGNLLSPFLKTGANVVEMGLTGSIAPVRQIATWLKQANGKEIPELQKIALRNDWKYFAWTALTVALLALATNDDDDEGFYIDPYEPGRRYDPTRPYDSIKIGGVWIKLDTFGPFSIPVRVAAKLVENWKNENISGSEALFKSYGFGLKEAIGETPMLSDLTAGADYMFKQPGKWASGYAYTQANKLVPAQIKPIVRAGSREAGIEWETPWMGKTIDRKFHRNYGLDGTQATTNDWINILTNRLKIIEE